MAKREANQRFPYLVVVVVVVVVVVALVLNNLRGLEGAQVFVPEEKRVKACLDSDPKNDWYLAGYAQVGVVKYDDFCDGNKLQQFYCFRGDDVKPTRSHQCEKGCQKGACLR